MKFACERCQTRYSIGDEKVRGKVLKIRCKTCGNIIVVREQATASAVAVAQQPVAQAKAASGRTDVFPNKAPPAGSTGPMPNVPRASQQPMAQQSVGVDVEWFVAIKGKQHGPAGRDDIARLFREGRINERTYLWNEGMGAWTRLKEVHELAFLLTEAPAKRPPPPPPPSEEGAEIVNFEHARQQRMQQQQSQLPHDPFAAVSGQNLVGDQNAPRDSTRVFIMQAGLANRSTKHRWYAGVAVGVFGLVFGAMALDYKGVIAIPGLHSVVNVVTQRTDEPAPLPIPAVAFNAADEDPELKCKLMPDPEECKKKVLAENAVRQKKRASHPANDDIKDGFQVGAPTDGPLRSGGANPTGFTEKSDPLAAAKIAEMLKTPGKGGPSVPKARMDTPSVAGSAMEAENVVKVVKDGAAGVQSCVEHEAKNGNLPTGKQRLVITVQPKGFVSEAKFTDGSTSASPVGECIRGVAKRWKFAPFPGQATDVEVPLILSVSM